MQSYLFVTFWVMISCLPNTFRWDNLLLGLVFNCSWTELIGTWNLFWTFDIKSQKQVKLGCRTLSLDERKIVEIHFFFLRGKKTRRDSCPHGLTLLYSEYILLSTLLYNRHSSYGEEDIHNTDYSTWPSLLSKVLYGDHCHYSFAMNSKSSLLTRIVWL